MSDEFYQGRLFSGFTIGRGNPILARIYNKTLEIKTSNKTWFHQVWGEAGRDGTNQVWRVEYQLRREVLKEFGIDELESLLEMEKSLWAYLTGVWLVIKQPDGGNVSRWKLKRKWKIVQKANYNQIASPLTREKVKMGNTKKLLDQGAGILLSIASLNNHENIEDTARLLRNWVDHKLKIPYLEEIIKRRKRFI